MRIIALSALSECARPQVQGRVPGLTESGVGVAGAPLRPASPWTPRLVGIGVTRAGRAPLAASEAGRQERGMRRPRGGAAGGRAGRMIRTWLMRHRLIRRNPKPEEPASKYSTPRSGQDGPPWPPRACRRVAGPRALPWRHLFPFSSRPRRALAAWVPPTQREKSRHARRPSRRPAPAATRFPHAPWSASSDAKVRPRLPPRRSRPAAGTQDAGAHAGRGAHKLYTRRKTRTRRRAVRAPRFREGERALPVQARAARVQAGAFGRRAPQRPPEVGGRRRGVYFRKHLQPARPGPAPRAPGALPPPP